MIIFVCPEPTPSNERDGLLQRVKAIDAEFEQHDRVILSLAFTRNLRMRVLRRSSTLTVEYLNVFLHWSRIYRLAKHASAVYVHTCNHALRILPLYLILKNIVTDLHGAVPEEIAVEGKRFASWRYKYIERVVVAHSAALIFVTRAMRAHFEKKYGTLRPVSFVIPIFSTLPPAVDQQRESALVIYAGGVQSWQCIDEMIEASLTLASQCRVIFLTGDPQTFRKKAEARGLKAQIETVPREELPRWYARACFGFVLRDDCVVNTVACPTKLVEYMQFGVIPIVKLVEIGDFASYGYRYIRLLDCVEGKLPSVAEMESARDINRSIVEQMAIDGRTELLNLVTLASQGKIRKAPVEIRRATYAGDR